MDWRGLEGRGRPNSAADLNRGRSSFDLSGGEQADAPPFPVLLDLGPDMAPRAAIGDKGYDSKANRAAAQARGIAPVILHKSNAREKPAFFPKALYKARARIEQAGGKLKRFKRVLRCEKTATNFLSFTTSPQASSCSNPSTRPSVPLAGCAS